MCTATSNSDIIPFSRGRHAPSHPGQCNLLYNRWNIVHPTRVKRLGVASDGGRTVRIFLIINTRQNENQMLHVLGRSDGERGEWGVGKWGRAKQTEEGRRVTRYVNTALTVQRPVQRTILFFKCQRDGQQYSPLSLTVLHVRIAFYLLPTVRLVASPLPPCGE